ncbi:MAG: hypothetical protein Q8R82_08390, partial [Hyphomonadaceae bacterium]|nr:hypothetical protein [Hyphomonadaceae bacterium]
MAGERRVFIFWDAEIDGPFRRMLERALAALQVDFADGSQVDFDPEAALPIKLAVLSPSSQSAPDDADIAVLGGPGEPHARSQLRLEASDIDGRTRKWIAFADKLGQKLGRPALAKYAADGTLEEQRALSLAFPADPLSKDFAPSHSPEALMEKAAAAEARAEAAERAIATAQLNEANAIRDRKTADATVAAERARITKLEREVKRLSALSESTAFALASLPADVRGVVSEAREHAWRARLAAAHATEAAATHPDALTWKNGASYSGETVNRQPHGSGIMTFLESGKEAARYAGDFVDGRRDGHGVATSRDGLVWTGAWKDDEACGCGLLETSDGQRFEGEVAPDESGAPRQV